jgi:hypothetical protein
MKEREVEDVVNDFGRSAVGERKEEAVSTLNQRSLINRNTTNEQVNTCPKMRTTYHTAPLQSHGHVPFPLKRTRSLQKSRRGKGRNGN